VVQAVVLRRDQPPAPRGQGQGLVAAQQPEHGHLRQGRGHGLLQQFAVPRRAHAVEKHPGQPQLRVESRESRHHRRRAAGHAARVHHQQHRRVQPLGELRRGAVLPRAVGAVEQAHDAFDHGRVRPRRVAGENLAHPGFAHHPAVQVLPGRP
jgi:hypothetical protein